MKYMVIKNQTSSIACFKTFEEAVQYVQDFGGYIVKLVEIGKKP